jgi:hypothetical protein
MWGSTEDVTAITALMRTMHGRSCPDYIIGADVVYHEHLIDPLVQTLKQLTDVAIAEHICPPVIILSYIQRFKRSRQFFKSMRRYFNVEERRVADVVDYDALNFQRVRDGLQPKQLLFKSTSADYVEFSQYIVELAKSFGSAECQGEHAPANATSSSSTPVVHHAVDSDTDSDEDKSAFGVFANVSTGQGEGAETDIVAQAADALGLPPMQPYNAYLYIITRRVG